MNSWNQNQNQNNMVVGQAQFNPYQNTMWGNYGQQRLPVYKADPIHGENAAWQFPIGGGEIYLPDADKDIIWWIRVDSNGNKNVTAFDVKPHEEPAPIDMNNIVERLNALEEKLNAKQNKSNAKRATVPATESITATID